MQSRNIFGGIMLSRKIGVHENEPQKGDQIVDPL